MYYSLSRFITKVTLSFAGLFLLVDASGRFRNIRNIFSRDFFFSLVLYIKTERRDFSLVCPTDKQSYK